MPFGNNPPPPRAAPAAADDLADSSFRKPYKILSNFPPDKHFRGMIYPHIRFPFHSQWEGRS
jgi:hypothetical protein